MKYWIRRAGVLTILLLMGTLSWRQLLLFQATEVTYLTVTPAGSGRVATPNSPGKPGNPHIYDRVCSFRRTTDKLSRKQPIAIVAIGSSSTEGAGASSPAKTYPAQLKSYLEASFPNVEIHVYNKGISGETAAKNLARFDRDVLALEPDLVIWQVGTNDALRGVPFWEFEQVIGSGVSQLRLHSVDVALLDLQYLGGGDDTDLARFQAGIVDLAERLELARIPRYSLMKGFMASGEYSRPDLVLSDGLHTTELVYQITADYTAGVITECVTERN